MYLPQATSRPPSIGAQSDLLLSTNRDQESRLEPSLVAFGSVEGPLPALPHISASACHVEAGRILTRIGPGAPSPGVGAWDWTWESSALKGLTIRVILEELCRF